MFFSSILASSVVLSKPSFMDGRGKFVDETRQTCQLKDSLWKKLEKLVDWSFRYERSREKSSIEPSLVIWLWWKRGLEKLVFKRKAYKLYVAKISTDLRYCCRRLRQWRFRFCFCLGCSSLRRHCGRPGFSCSTYSIVVLRLFLFCLRRR